MFSEGLDPTPDELRAFPLESRLLLSNRPEIQLQKDVLVRVRDDTVQLVVPVNLRRRLFDLPILVLQLHILVQLAWFNN